MNTISLNLRQGTALLVRGVFLVMIAAGVVGCGAITVRHVPKVAISPAKMPDLHGTQPIELKAGEASSEEAKIGTVGMGKVVGKMSDWTAATVEAVSVNLAARGATLKTGAPKAMTITVTRAEVSAIPLVGVSNSKIILTATTPDGLKSTFEGSGSSMAPLGAVNGAASDAITKLLKDTSVNAYLAR